MMPSNNAIILLFRKFRIKENYSLSIQAGIKNEFIVDNSRRLL
jgi:hypothetical protein